jgi:hypothetical protein
MMETWTDSSPNSIPLLESVLLPKVRTPNSQLALVRLNVCASGESSDSIFIVGATAGMLDTTGTATLNPGDDSADACVSKINVIALETEWTTQFHATNPNASGSAACALGCQVTDDGQLAHVAGFGENVALPWTILSKSNVLLDATMSLSCN